MFHYVCDSSLFIPISNLLTFHLTKHDLQPKIIQISLTCDPLFRPVLETS